LVLKRECCSKGAPFYQPASTLLISLRWRRHHQNYFRLVKTAAGKSHARPGVSPGTSPWAGNFGLLWFF